MPDQPTIRIFRPGTFTDIHGRTITFSQGDLDEIVKSYDFASDPAPLVIGHPQHNHPAWGWVERLAIDGDQLVATPVDVEPAFGEAVKAKRYRKVSASFYQPTDPNNPKPGAWYLKHVGFLGAKAPAVKGLGTVAFSEAVEAAAVTIDLELENDMDTADDAARAAAFAEQEQQLTARGEALDTRSSELDTREAGLAAREAAFAERDAADAEAARNVRHDANVAFAEAMIEAGTLAPAGKLKVVGLMDHLEATATVSFGEGDDAVELTPLAAFTSLLEGASPVVAFGEHAPADKGAPTAPSSEDIANQAVAFMETEKAAGRTVSTQAAVRHVMRQAETN